MSWINGRPSADDNDDGEDQKMAEMYQTIRRKFSAGVDDLTFTIAECSVILSCSDQTVYNVIDEGLLKAIQVKGGKRVTVGAMKKYLAEAMV